MRPSTNNDRPKRGSMSLQKATVSNMWEIRGDWGSAASGEGDDALTRSLLWDQAANTLIPQFLREVPL